jgi:hypothetical protein
VTCPSPPPGADEWISCAGNPPHGPCLDTCAAIRAGGAYLHTLNCH